MTANVVILVAQYWDFDITPKSLLSSMYDDGTVNEYAMVKTRLRNEIYG